MEFSTFDVDRDTSSGNCAEYFRGANWWNRCGNQNVNGPYEENIENVIKLRCILWKDRQNPVKKIHLMVRPAV